MGLDGLDFGFLRVGVLDSDGIWVGFGLVGWIGVVGSGLFGCFCYGFAWFFFFFFFFWGFGSCGILVGSGGMVGMVVV